MESTSIITILAIGIYFLITGFFLYKFFKNDMVLKDTKFKVYKIEEFKNGVKVSMQNSDNGNIAMLSKEGEVIVFGFEECEKVLLGLRG